MSYRKLLLSKSERFVYTTHNDKYLLGTNAAKAISMVGWFEGIKSVLKKSLHMMVDTIIYTAVKHGHRRIVKFLVPQHHNLGGKGKKNDINDAFMYAYVRCASANGNNKMLCLLHRLFGDRAFVPCNIFGLAAQNGHIKTLVLLRKWTHWLDEDVVLSAIQGGHVRALKLVMKYCERRIGGVPDENIFLRHATLCAPRNYVKILKILRNYGCTDFAGALADLAESNGENAEISDSGLIRLFKRVREDPERVKAKRLLTKWMRE